VDPPPYETEAAVLQETWVELATKAGKQSKKKPLVIVVDGADQIGDGLGESEGYEAGENVWEWIPPAGIPNVRIVLSTQKNLPNEAYDAEGRIQSLRDHMEPGKMRNHVLASLKKVDAFTLVRSSLVGKEIGRDGVIEEGLPSTMDALLNMESIGIPFYISIVLAALSHCDDKFARSRAITDHIAPTALGIIRQNYGQLEKDFDKHIVVSVVSQVVVSSAWGGATEIEIMQAFNSLTPPRLKGRKYEFSALMNRLRDCGVQSTTDGRLVMSCDFLVTQTSIRYRLVSKKQFGEANGWLAEHFTNLACGDATGLDGAWIGDRVWMRYVQGALFHATLASHPGHAIASCLAQLPVGDKGLGKVYVLRMLRKMLKSDNLSQSLLNGLAERTQVNAGCDCNLARGE